MDSIRENQSTDAPAAPATEPDLTPRWDGLSAEQTAMLVRAVLRDLDTIADRLALVAEAFGDLEHNQRVRLNKDAPDLVGALLTAERYHASRRVPRPAADVREAGR